MEQEDPLTEQRRRRAQEGLGYEQSIVSGASPGQVVQESRLSKTWGTS